MEEIVNREQIAKKDNFISTFSGDNAIAACSKAVLDETLRRLPEMARIWIVWDLLFMFAKVIILALLIRLASTSNLMSLP